MSGVEFRRRIRIAKGIYLNLSKSGIGFSIGERGIHYSVGPTGKHVSLGIPGTGLYYRRKLGGEKKESGKELASQTRLARHEAVTQDTPIEVPSVGMLASHFEKQFHRGCVAYQTSQYNEAYQIFEGLIEEQEYGVRDAQFMTALCASYIGNNSQAIDLLTYLLTTEGTFPGSEGTLTAAYLSGVTVRVPITQFAFVELDLGFQLSMFLLSELLRAEGRDDQAMAMLEEIILEVPDFRYAHLALADLYCLTEHYDQLFQLLSDHERHLENDDDIALELMYYWAIALTVKEMYEAAEDVYHRALAKSKGRNRQLLEIIQYGHADMYERWGKKAEALKYFEKLYAYDPQFYDVADRVSALQAA